MNDALRKTTMTYVMLYVLHVDLQDERCASSER